MLLDAALPSRRPARAGAVASTAAIVAALVALAAVATRPAGWFEREWPHDASAAISRVTADSWTRVLSDDRYADWLLWEHPELAGRVAYDVRFELFDPDEFETLFRYRNQIGDDWAAAARGYDVLALDHRVQQGIVDSSVRDGYRIVYRDDRITVLSRARS
jgi:hypothetical protein